jgi:hypothetical protein
MGNHQATSTTEGADKQPIISLTEDLTTRAAVQPGHQNSISEDMTLEYWKATHPPPYIHIAIDNAYLKHLIEGYNQDIAFEKIWMDLKSKLEAWHASKQFYKDQQGLLYFMDADYQPQLCILQMLRSEILKEVHDSPYETAHTGAEKLWKRLSSKFYWPRMKKDLLRFIQSCDVCQKTKNSNFNHYSLLIPNPILTQPYKSISMDFVVNVPWSGDYNAVLVIVDRLTKHALFLPTTTGLNVEGFTYMFIRNVGCRFGLSTSIISDQDPCFISDFWRAVSSYLKTRLAMSSLHHPQHNGQMEITNWTMETMLRAYTASQNDSWSEWLFMLEHTYNSNVNTSMGVSPYYLLYGFNPQSLLDLLTIDAQMKKPIGLSMSALVGDPDPYL